MNSNWLPSSVRSAPPPESAIYGNGRVGRAVLIIETDDRFRAGQPQRKQRRVSKVLSDHAGVRRHLDRRRMIHNFGDLQFAEVLSSEKSVVLNAAPVSVIEDA